VRLRRRDAIAVDPPADLEPADDLAPEPLVPWEELYAEARRRGFDLLPAGAFERSIAALEERLADAEARAADCLEKKSQLSDLTAKVFSESGGHQMRAQAAEEHATQLAEVVVRQEFGDHFEDADG
jgi:hypothetical protein